MNGALVKTIRGAAIALMIAGSLLAQHALRAQPSAMLRIDLQRHDLSIAGREAVQVRVELEKGAAFPRHSDLGEEMIYLFQGLLQYQFDGKPPVKLKAGEVLFVPAGTVDTAKNVGGGTESELATHIVEKGKPLLTLLE